MANITLPRVIDLAAATGLAATLHTADGSLCCDGSAVERIGIAGLQVLLSARLTAICNKEAFSIERASDPLRAATRSAGVEWLLATAAR